MRAPGTLTPDRRDPYFPTMAPPDRGRLRAIIGGSVGNLVEWYDWYTYSAFALYFAGSFFPKGDATAQLLNTAAVFAVGFFMRPVGSWLLGRYADRHGRRAALAGSVWLMCAGSLLIAVTPSYETIGVAAPVLLVVARLLQGVSVGGEYGASATYLSERAGRARRGYYTSFQYVTLILGQLLALVVLLVLQRVLPEASLTAWGWRIPFVIGACAAIVAVWMRHALDETESFTRAQQAQQAPARGLRGLARHGRAAWTVFGLTAGGALAFYICTTYAQKFLVNTTGLSKAVASQVNAITLVGFMLLQPLVGALSDRIGRRPILLTFGVLGTLGTVPLLTALETATPARAVLLLGAALTVVTCYTSINAVVKAELFPTEVRALGVALPYSLAVSLFGGTAEYVALWLKGLGHERWFYWYATAVIAASLVVYWRMPDTRDASKILED